MVTEVLKDVPLKDVQAEHRAFFLGLADSPTTHHPPELRHAFLAYAQHSLRSFPWRAAGVLPFQLLVAELLLVQTKAVDVAHVWPSLIARYPEPARLARARLSSLTTLLRPLGLHHQRANALRLLARHLVREWCGRLPSSLIDLLSLPHVGLYTASAVSCFAYHRRVPIVDANVLRVFARIFGLPAQRELRRSRQAWAIAWAILPEQHAAQHNYALLDFAATVCTPKKPHCTECPISGYWDYAQQAIAPAIDT
jgi:A/G-specific adenine glycosylase